MTSIPDHLQPLYRKLLELPASPPPAPWREASVHAVGGLTDVAFADDSDLLLVISSGGRGLFDCTSNKRVARDPSETFEHDTANLLVDAIGPVASSRLRTAGIHGGGLAMTTIDGWTLDLLTLSWPHHSLFLTAPGQWLYDPAFGKPGETTKLATDSEIRACGFSPTGRAFILATSSDLTIFHREA